MIRLSSNENCYGCSKKVSAAIKIKHAGAFSYPEMNPVLLKEKLAEKFSVKIDNIVLGAGSVSLIDGLIQTFVGSDQEIITFDKSFVAYGLLSSFHGRKCKFAPLSALRCLPDNLLPFINKKTGLIFIANPNNPTGTIIHKKEIIKFMNAISKNILVVLDEAYAEYAADADFPNTIQIQKRFSNLIILRSFSKIYGLAGLRIGYGIMHHELASKMISRQIPHSLNYLAADTAIKALEDKEFVSSCAARNSEQRDYLFKSLIKLGYHTCKSYANFIYLWFDSEDEKLRVYNTLLENHIQICDLRSFHQEKSLRITVGTNKVNHEIINILKKLE